MVETGSTRCWWSWRRWRLWARSSGGTRSCGSSRGSTNAEGSRTRGRKGETLNHEAERGDPAEDDPRVAGSRRGGRAPGRGGVDDSEHRSPGGAGAGWEVTVVCLADSAGPTRRPHREGPQPAARRSGSPGRTVVRDGAYEFQLDLSTMPPIVLRRGCSRLLGGGAHCAAALP